MEFVAILLLFWIFWPYEACGILASQWGSNPLPVLQGEALNTGPSGAITELSFLKYSLIVLFFYLKSISYSAQLADKIKLRYSLPRVKQASKSPAGWQQCDSPVSCSSCFCALASCLVAILFIPQFNFGGVGSWLYIWSWKGEGSWRWWGGGLSFHNIQNTSKDSAFLAFLSAHCKVLLELSFSWKNKPWESTRAPTCLL